MSVANSGASSVKGRNIAEFRGRSGPLARAAARRRRHPVSVPSRSRLGAPDFFGRPGRGSSRYGPGNSSPFGATYGAVTGRRRHFFLFGVPRYGRDFAGRLETGHARRDRASSICSAWVIPSGRKNGTVVGTSLGFESPDQATAQKVKVERSLPRTVTEYAETGPILSRRRADGTGTFCKMRRTCVRLGMVV